MKEKLQTLLRDNPRNLAEKFDKLILSNDLAAANTLNYELLLAIGGIKAGQAKHTLNFDALDSLKDANLTSIDINFSESVSLTDNKTSQQVSFSDKEFLLLIEWVKNKNSITDFKIYNGGLTEVSAHLLVEAFYPKANLTALNIGDNPVGDTGILALVKLLDINSLTELNISRTGMKLVGMKALAKKLETNTSLTSLNINNNPYVEEEGFITLMKALTSNNTLKCLDSANAGSKQKGTEWVGRLLLVNNSLNKLSFDQHHYANLQILGKGLKYNTTLKHIEFDCPLHELLSLGMQFNSTLTSLSCPLKSEVYPEFAKWLAGNCNLTYLNIVYFTGESLITFPSFVEMVKNNSSLIELKFSTACLQSSIEKPSRGNVDQTAYDIKRDIEKNMANTMINYYLARNKDRVESKNALKLAVELQLKLSSIEENQLKLENQLNEIKSVLTSRNNTAQELNIEKRNIELSYSSINIIKLLKLQLGEAAIIEILDLEHDRVPDDHIEAIIKTGMVENKPIIMPVHLQGESWVGVLLVKHDEDLKIIFNNPSGSAWAKEEKTKYLLSTLRDQAERSCNVIIVDLIQKQQQTVIDESGLFTVNNLVVLASNSNVDSLNKVELQKLIVSAENTNIEDTKQKHTKLLTNFTGKGMFEHQEKDYWQEYSKDCIDNLLHLRLKNIDVDKNIKVITPNYIFNGSIDSAEKLVKDVSVEMNNNVLFINLNLYGKHWTGIIVDNRKNEIELHYLDSEQQQIPAILRKKLQEKLQVSIKEDKVELQKYNNCGPEVIENFMQYLTGHRLSQEDAVAVHSILYEESVTLAGNY